MAVPKKKKSKASRNQRRSHHAKTAAVLIKCSQCNSLILPHQVCNICGTYRGKQILSVARVQKRTKNKLELKALRRKEKAANKEQPEKKAKADTTTPPKSTPKKNTKKKAAK